MFVSAFAQQLDEFVSYGLPDYYYNVMSAQDIARHVMSLQGRCENSMAKLAIFP
jgi:hypothetical protein